jgi:hypothetical protein
MEFLMSASVELIEVEESLILSARKKTVFRQSNSVDGDSAFFISLNFHGEIAMTNDAVAIARAAYEAYVKRTAPRSRLYWHRIFILRARSTTGSIARRTSPVAGRTASRSLHSISFTSFRKESGYSSPTKAAARMAAGFATLKFVTIRGRQIVDVEVYFGWSVPHEAPIGGFIDKK